MIDLRSDTLTKPTDAMRQAMAHAPVGDDVYSEDPTVLKLQEQVAGMLGHEAGLFVPSGVMGNQLCIRVHTQPGNEVICDDEAHIFHYETAAPAVLSGVQLVTVPSNRGLVHPEQLKNAVRPEIYYNAKSALYCAENSHNRHGGASVSTLGLRGIVDVARSLGLATHLDGARLWNVTSTDGVDPKEYGSLFDSVSVCLSKGLGAPVGSVIVGSKDVIEEARHYRKMFGGGMRQVGILAAAGLYALEHNYERLVEDSANATLFAQLLHDIEGIDVDPADTNIVVFRTDHTIPYQEFEHMCAQEGLKFALIKPGYARAVMYLGITREQVVQAAEIIGTVVRRLRRKEEA